MTKERYSTDKDNSIIEHEHYMLNEYQSLTEKYSDLFKEYSYMLETSLFWIDDPHKVVSGERIPFKNGYSCYIEIKVTQNGEVVRCEDDEGEVDYYDLSLTYGISYISRNFFKRTIVLIEKDNEVEEDIRNMLNLLEQREKIS